VISIPSLTETMFYQKGQALRKQGFFDVKKRNL